MIVFRTVLGHLRVWIDSDSWEHPMQEFANYAAGLTPVRAYPLEEIGVDGFHALTDVTMLVSAQHAVEWWEAEVKKEGA